MYKDIIEVHPIADGWSHITFNFRCPVDLRSIIDEDMLLRTVRHGEQRKGPINLSSIWVVRVNKTWIEAWNPQCYQSRDGKRERGERETKFRPGCWQSYELIQSSCLSVCPLDLLTELNGTPCIMYETSILLNLDFKTFEGWEILYFILVRNLTYDYYQKH